MTYISNLAVSAERDAKAMAQTAASLKESAELFVKGVKGKDMSLQVRAMLPFLAIQNEARQSHLSHYSEIGKYVEDRLVLSKRERGRLVAIDVQYLSPAEAQFLEHVNSMKEGDEVYRIFWQEAARDVATMDVEDFSRGEWAHYVRCRAVARRLWPKEDDTMPKSWRPDWEAVKNRLKAA